MRKVRGSPLLARASGSGGKQRDCDQEKKPLASTAPTVPSPGRLGSEYTPLWQQRAEANGAGVPCRGQMWHHRVMRLLGRALYKLDLAELPPRPC